MKAYDGMASGKKRILIVDDNEFFLKQQVACLDSERFQIQTATSGRDALDKIRSTPPDLVLLDQIMEDMSGWSICRIMKADTATVQIPVIIVSSGEKELSRKEAVETGCDGIIFKPIRRDQLLGLVDEYFGVAFRRWARAQVCIKCETNYEGIVKDGTILSLGGGGIFLGGGPLFLRGDTCQLRFSLPNQDREVYVREAMVVWLGQINGTGPEGAGLKFLTLPKDDQNSIDQYVASLLS